MGAVQLCQPGTITASIGFGAGASRIRTGGLPGAIQGLSHLSYSPSSTPGSCEASPEGALLNPDELNPRGASLIFLGSLRAGQSCFTLRSMVNDVRSRVWGVDGNGVWDFQNGLGAKLQLWAPIRCPSGK